MNRGPWVCSAIAALGLVGEARAQVVVPFFGPGYGFSYGGGLGFGFQRRHFALGGFFGGSYSVYSPYGYGAAPFAPFAPYGAAYGYRQLTIVTPPPVVLASSSRRRLVPEEDYDLSGVDLDLVSPDDLLKPRAELERIMGEKKRELALRPPQPRPRIAPPADVPPPPRKPAAPQVKQPAPAKPQPPADIPPGKEYPRLLEFGRQAFQQQLYGIAAQRFAQASIFDANKALPHFLLSQARFAQGKYAQAVRAIEKGMRLQQDWPLAKFQPRADLYKDNDDYVIHLKRLEDALTAEPKNADYLFLLAHQLWFAGFRERAAELFRRARPLAADPAFIDLFLRAAPAPKVAVN